MAHGNEDTLREMLRIKRSVQAVYNTQVTPTNLIRPWKSSNLLYKNLSKIIMGLLTPSPQVNMMASAMMADTPAGTGTIADLAPTMTMGLKVLQPLLP